MHRLANPLRQVSVLLFFALISTSVFGQTTIRERVEIQPKVQQSVFSHSSSSSVLHQVDASKAAVSLPGVTLTVTGVSVNVPSLPFPSNNVAGLYLELRVDASGGGAFPLKRYFVCEGNVTEQGFPLPTLNLSSCGQVYVLYKVISWSGFARCHPRESLYKFALASVGGTGGTFTIQDTVFNAFSAPVPVSATVAVAAGLRPGFEVAQLAVLPGKTTLQCTDNTPVNVTLKNASGQTVTICGGTTLQATASLEGVGPYAFLRQGTQEGQTIRFPVTASSFSFMAVLDTSRGVIPLGNRQATLRVTVEGVEGTANINLTCPYPPPAVTITHPAQDTTIVLTQNNQPLIILKEEHTPSSGKFEPVISWQPSDRIDTREYFDTMQSGDTVEVQVTVMAENIAQMRAQDTRRVWLVKKGCDDAPECPPVFPVTPPITIVARPNGFAGVNVCEKPTTLGGFAVVTGPQMIAPYEVDACFDRSTGRWRFAVPQGIQLNAVQDLCYENIRRNGQELVSDVTQIPKSECSRALEDFRLHYEYPLGHSVGRMPKYLVAQALLWHEEAHRRFEQRLLSEN